MIETAITNLIDRCIQLLKERKLRKRSEFNDFIKPLFEQFESVHSDYLESFRKYRRLLQENQNISSNSHPVFNAINEDHVFSSGIRERLSTISQIQKVDNKTVRFIQDGDDMLTMPQMEPLDEMIWCIQLYIKGGERAVFYDDLNYISNFPRSSLYSGLKFLFSASQNQIESLKFSSGQNCFDFAMQMTGIEVTSPPIVTIRDDNSWGFVIKINSKAQWDNLQSNLIDAKGDINKAKIALGIALIDKIVSRNQTLYAHISECFENVRIDYLK